MSARFLQKQQQQGRPTIKLTRSTSRSRRRRAAMTKTPLFTLAETETEYDEESSLTEASSSSSSNSISHNDDDSNNSNNDDVNPHSDNHEKVPTTGTSSLVVIPDILMARKVLDKQYQVQEDEKQQQEQQQKAKDTPIPITDNDQPSTDIETTKGLSSSSAFAIQDEAAKSEILYIPQQKQVAERQLKQPEQEQERKQEMEEVKKTTVAVEVTIVSRSIQKEEEEEKKEEVIGDMYNATFSNAQVYMTQQAATLDRLLHEYAQQFESIKDTAGASMQEKLETIRASSIETDKKLEVLVKEYTNGQMAWMQSVKKSLDKHLEAMLHADDNANADSQQDNDLRTTIDVIPNGSLSEKEEKTNSQDIIMSPIVDMEEANSNKDNVQKEKVQSTESGRAPVVEPAMNTNDQRVNELFDKWCELKASLERQLSTINSDLTNQAINTESAAQNTNHSWAIHPKTTEKSSAKSWVSSLGKAIKLETDGKDIVRATVVAETTSKGSVSQPESTVPEQPTLSSNAETTTTTMLTNHVMNYIHMTGSLNALFSKWFAHIRQVKESLDQQLVVVEKQVDNHSQRAKSSANETFHILTRGRSVCSTTGKTGLNMLYKEEEKKQEDGCEEENPTTNSSEAAAKLIYSIRRLTDEMKLRRFEAGMKRTTGMKRTAASNKIPAVSATKKKDKKNHFLDQWLVERDVELQEYAKQASRRERIQSTSGQPSSSNNSEPSVDAVEVTVTLSM